MSTIANNNGRVPCEGQELNALSAATDEVGGVTDPVLGENSSVEPRRDGDDAALNIDSLRQPLPEQRPSTAVSVADLAALRVEPNSDLVEETVECPVALGRPGKQHWVQLVPQETFTFTTLAVKIEGTGDIYIVAPTIAEDLVADTRTVTFVAYITKSGLVGFWPIKCPDANGEIDSWNKSARTMLQAHASQWLRVVSDQTNDCYTVVLTKGTWAAPVMPEEGFEALFARAITGKVIADSRHAVYRCLLGLDD